jgi:hypothetical protein
MGVGEDDRLGLWSESLVIRAVDETVWLVRSGAHPLAIAFAAEK